MRKEAAKARYAAYLKGWTEKALYAEAFLLALWPVGATIALLGAASIIMSPDKGFSFYNYYNLVGVYLLTYFLAGQVLREKRQVRILLATIGAARMRVKRLIDDHLAEKTGEVKDGKTQKSCYRKTGIIML